MPKYEALPDKGPAVILAILNQTGIRHTEQGCKTMFSFEMLYLLDSTGDINARMYVPSMEYFHLEKKIASVLDIHISGKYVLISEMLECTKDVQLSMKRLGY